jgi:hypothetical protein
MFRFSSIWRASHTTIRGIAFTGSEAKKLAEEAATRGYSSTVWLTQKQGEKDCGTMLRPGATGIKRFHFGKWYLLYNADQFENPSLCTVDHYAAARQEYMKSKDQIAFHGKYIPRSIKGHPFPPAEARLLTNEALTKGYKSDCWLTKSQVEAAGATIKEGTSPVVVHAKVAAGVEEFIENVILHLYNAESTTDPSLFVLSPL